MKALINPLCDSQTYSIATSRILFPFKISLVALMWWILLHHTIAISVLNTNYTCDLLKESGVFALSVLDEQCTFDSIKHFGFQSGRDVDKFEGIKMPEDINGIPYMGWYACAVISGRVVERHDLGTHTLFIAEVVDAKTLSDKAPLTYADYQAHVKPKADKPPKTDKKIVGWRCKICNYVYEGSELPAD